MEERSPKRRPTTRRVSVGVCLGLLLVFVVVGSSGCFSHFGLPWKAKTGSPEKSESDATKSDDSPSENPAADLMRSEAKPAGTDSGSTLSGTTSEPTGKVETIPSGDRPAQSPPRPSPPSPVPSDRGVLTSVNPDVRKAALEKAAGLSAVEWMKICHIQDRDEWWVVLYDNIGLFIDVKQHVWNKETKKLERVLALKQIMHSKLEANLRQGDSGKKCEVFYRPRGESSLFAWKAVDPSNARITTRSVPSTDVAAIPAPAPPASGRNEKSHTPSRAYRQSSAQAEKPQVKEKEQSIAFGAAVRPAPTSPRESAPAAVKDPPKAREAKQTPRAAHGNDGIRSTREEQPDKAVLSFLQNWKAAWEDKDFSRFQNLYHPNFRADSLDFNQFLNRKNDFFNRYQYIRVELDGIKMKKAGNRVEVTFLQNFRGDNYGDKGVKHMVLDVSKPKNMRILSETWSPR